MIETLLSFTRWDMLATLTLGMAMIDFSILPIPILTLSVEESIISDSLVASIHQRAHKLNRGKMNLIAIMIKEESDD